MFDFFSELFAPGRRHTAEERERLELSREDLGIGDPARGPIDLTSGKVTLRHPGAGVPGGPHHTDDPGADMQGTPDEPGTPGAEVPGADVPGTPEEADGPGADVPEAPEETDDPDPDVPGTPEEADGPDEAGGPRP
ncbi:DUF6191 domain-containing protein [Streptomyces sp. NPDC058330]|uniref:DUF6191 domain-containing protein n=1 Tax=Streptomyces sp. NPDC058330 TaxID=3346449 RepID=UPI0036ED6178